MLPLVVVFGVTRVAEFFDEGWELEGAWYEPPRDDNTKSPVIVLRVACFPGKPLRLPGGLLPPECDLLRSHLPDDGSVVRPTAAEEGLVVGTLATLLRQRGIRLIDRTISHLHGHDILVDGHIKPPFGSTWLAEAVNDLGWDKIVDLVAAKQGQLFARRQGRGAPKKEEKDRRLHELILAGLNAWQAAGQYAAEHGGTQNTHYKYITDQPWYQEMTKPPTTAKKREPPPAAPVVSHDDDLKDSIDRIIKRRGGATIEEIVDGLAEIMDRPEPRWIKTILRFDTDRYIEDEHTHIWSLRK